LWSVPFHEEVGVLSGGVFAALRTFEGWGVHYPAMGCLVLFAFFLCIIGLEYIQIYIYIYLCRSFFSLCEQNNFSVVVY
jgi:hypothetical protein